MSSRFVRPMVLAAVAALLAAPSALKADVKLPAIFSEHMVLQRDLVAPVWGWAAPDEEVTVTFGGQTKKAKADKDGKWMVKLDKLTSGEMGVLTVEGKNKLTVNDVLVGEVWLCSGQSNMGMQVSGAKDFPAEKAAADHPHLRMFTETSGASPEIQTECHGAWKVCTPENVGGFSATAYFFGRDLHKQLKVPVGLINSSVGGTPIEAWISLDAQKKHSEFQPFFDMWSKKIASWDPAKAQSDYEKQMVKFKDDAEKAKAAGKPAPRQPNKAGDPSVDSHRPANLFNAKIATLVPYAIRGAIWYQGESNANQLATVYGLQLQTLIEDWRSRWGEGEFPFAWVQLPNFKKPVDKPAETTDWVTVREQMLKTLSVPNTGMAITIELGEADNIHPKNKQEVGRRLALWALAEVYKEQVESSSGPLAAGHEVKGKEIVVHFKHVDGGLKAKGGEELKGFAIAGKDKKWVAATAKVSGDSVIVSSPDVTEPTAVRYAWADNPDCNLYNGAGLPAAPFRTDSW